MNEACSYKPYQATLKKAGYPTLEKMLDDRIMQSSENMLTLYESTKTCSSYLLIKIPR